MSRTFSVLLACAFLCTANAEPPPLDGLYPAGAGRGTTNTITAAGKFNTWPVNAWISGEGVAVAVETNKGKLIVTVAPNAGPGPRLVRLHTDDGASDPRMFVVGGGRELGETEPNNRFDQPQQLPPGPGTINGRLDKNGDVDSFRVNLRAGDWLVAHADCYTLLSKADSVLRLVDTNGLQLAWNHDFTALDPRLVWQATNDQPVVLQLFGFAYPPGSEVALTGGEGVVYRLHVDVTNSAPTLCETLTESEPNDTAANSGRVEPPAFPAAVIGVIDRAGDEDRYQFSATKDAVYEARIEAASFGSPLDAWMKIEDLQGQQRERSDDVERSPDPRIEWKAGTNSTFVVAVGSVIRRGGADHFYRLSLKKLEPDFAAKLLQKSVVLKAGETNELKLELKRLRGFTNELAVSFENLPEGVTALTTNLSAKDSGAVTLRLAATPGAKSFSGPVHMDLTSEPPLHIRRRVPFELTTPDETGYSRLLVEQSDDLWLTVRPTPSDPPKPAPASK